MPIQGSLRDLSVLEAIQLIGTQRKTVTLRLQCDPEEYHLHFVDGLLVASHRRGGEGGEPFLEALVGLAHISPQEAMRIAQQLRTSSRDLWSLVRDIPHLDRDTCARVYLLTTEAMIDRVLVWDHGHFALLPPAKIERVFTPGLSVDTLLLDAMRRLDELASLKNGPLRPESIPGLTAPEGPAASPDPVRRAIARHTDGRRTTQEIVEATHLGEYAVYSTLTEGMEAGWVCLVGTAPPGAAVPQAPPRSRARARGRGALQRAPSLLLLFGFLALGLGSTWLGQRFAQDRRPWLRAEARWEEIDVRRMVEVYRYRHGDYPTDLAQLGQEGLPLPKDFPARWRYERVSSSYDLSPR